MPRPLISHLLALLTLCGILFGAGAAFAQDSERVIVLKFETFDVEEDVLKNFYQEVNNRLADHPNKEIAQGGEVTINEMLVTIGCEGATPECLLQLKDFVEGDQLLFGSIQRSEDIHLFTLRLFDLNTGEFVGNIEDQTVQGGREAVDRAIPALVDSLLYGDVGKLQILVSGADAPDIFFDGEKVGKAPTTLENLPLGEHVVMVRTDDGKEETRKVILQRGDASRLNFNFADGPAQVSDSSSPSNAPRVAGFVLIGVGVASAAFGGYQRVRLSALESELEEKVNGNRVSQADVARVRELEEEMNSAYTGFGVGVGVGLGAIAIGTGLVVLTGAKSAETARLKDIRMDIAPTREGAHAGLSFSF